MRTTKIDKFSPFKFSPFYETCLELAKIVEVWLANLRYCDNNINYDISTDALVQLNNLHKKIELSTDSFGVIKYWIQQANEKGYETPEEIKNRVLMIETFPANNKAL